MNEIGIGEVARRAGVRPSAVRYYEERGLIAPDTRRGGKRVYAEEAVERMTLIMFAKQLGFTLDEIRMLLSGFSNDVTAGERWATLAADKIAQLDVMAKRIEVVRAALERISHCECSDLDECAHSIAKEHR